MEIKYEARRDSAESETDSIRPSATERDVFEPEIIQYDLNCRDCTY